VNSAELVSLAEKLVHEHASAEALNHMDAKLRPLGKQDDVKYQSIMFARDAMQYIIFKSAVKHGDVGLMEAFLPDLLFRFVGGKNSNYTIEVLELLQGVVI